MRCAAHVARTVRGETHNGFWCGNPRERDHLEFLGINGRIILKSVLKKWNVGMEWIDLVQRRDGWRDFVNAVMNLRVPKSVEYFLTS